MNKNKPRPEPEASIRGAATIGDEKLGARWDAALEELRRLRRQAQIESLHEQKTALARRAWEVAGPLYDLLEPLARQDDGVHFLLARLDGALMGVLDDPLAGRGLLRQEGPAAGPPEEDADEQPCCLTLIRLRNLMAMPARVTASGALGADAAHVFRPGERRPLRREEIRREDEGGGATIPGGLGRCVTVTVEIQDGAGRWVEVMSRPVCCDTHSPGDILHTTPPSGGSTAERPSPTLEILEMVVERPCTPSGARLSSDGRWGHEFRESPGLDVPGKGHFIGAHTFLLYVPPEECAQFCFIQAVKRTVTLDGADAGLSHDWQLDLLPDQPRRPPCYAYQRNRPEGGRLLNDSPGLVNPWGAIRLEDGRVLRPRPGQRLEARWEFRTWAVCLRPARLYGQFSWTLKVELTVPAGPPPAGGQVPDAEVDLDEPEFTPRDEMSEEDERLFREVMG